MPEEDRPGPAVEGTPVTAGTAVFLRRPLHADEAEFLAMAASGGAERERWIRAPRSPQEYAAYLVHTSQPAADALLVCTKDGGYPPGAIAGVFNVSEISPRRSSASLSYYAHASYAGRGLMSEGLGLLLGYAFGPLGLRLLAARVDADNAASVRLVERAGFRREKDTPRYLQLVGVFRSHPTWTLTADRWREPG